VGVHADIIAMLVVSIALLAAFVCWQWYIEMRLQRPPLVRLALFTRGKGKLSVVYAFVVRAALALLYMTETY